MPQCSEETPIIGEEMGIIGDGIPKKKAERVARLVEV